MFTHETLETIHFNQSFKHISYRELQMIAKQLELSAGGKRIKIIGRIRMNVFWRNKRNKKNNHLKKSNQWMISKSNILQNTFISTLWMIWVYMILTPSQIHPIRPRLMITY